MLHRTYSPSPSKCHCVPKLRTSSATDRTQAPAAHTAVLLPAILEIVPQIHGAAEGGHFPEGPHKYYETDYGGSNHFFPEVHRLPDLTPNKMPEHRPVVIDVNSNDEEKHIAEYSMDGPPLVFTKSPNLPVGPVGDPSRRGNI